MARMSSQSAALLGFGFAFGDEWSDWCGQNWSRYYTSQGQCHKGANGAGWQVGFNAPWTAAGVAVRGGDFAKKAVEIAPSVIDQAKAFVTPTAEPAAEPWSKTAGMIPVKGGIWNADAGAATSKGVMIGAALLVAGAALLFLKKGRRSALNGYSRRRTHLKRAR